MITINALSTATRIYFLLSTTFAVLSYYEWTEPSKASGRWGWLNTLANTYLSPNGYAKLMMVMAIIFLISFFISATSNLNTSKGESK